MSYEVEIEIGTPKVRGVNREYSGLLDVEVPLTPRPDGYWTQIFNGGPPGVSFSVSMHPPRLSGATVHLQPPDDAIEKYVASLRERVAGTNAHYNREVAPRLARAKAAEEAEAADRARRVEEARLRLEQSAANDAA